MITENLSTLKIHKLTQEQYDRAAAAGNLETDALYLTPAKIGGNINAAPMIVRPISETNVDITPAEIMAAQREGRNVYFLFDEEVHVPLLIALNEFAVFSINSAENTLEITVYEDSSFKITETSLEDRVNELINAGVETSFATVVVTVDSDNNTNISADEIKAAYESGKSVFLSLGSDYIPLYAAYKNTDANGDGNEAIFRFYMDSIVSADFIVRHNKMTVRDFPYALKLDIPTDDHINGLIDKKMSGNQWILTDESTGKKYKLAVMNGKLTMTEVE